MSDFDIVREAFSWQWKNDSEQVKLQEKALDALDRIEAVIEDGFGQTAGVYVSQLRAENERLRAQLQEMHEFGEGCIAADAEIVRLRRIEQAAREVGGIWDAIDATADNPDAPGVPWNVVEASLVALRTALEGSEP